MYILAYDFGTGGIKASLYGADGACVASGFDAYPTTYPASGFHEQAPEDWWRATVRSTRLLAALLVEPGGGHQVIEEQRHRELMSVLNEYRNSTPSEPRRKKQVRRRFAQDKDGNLLGEEITEEEIED